MLREQVFENRPAHPNGYAVCIDNFDFDTLEELDVFHWSCKDDGFCVWDTYTKGNYICFECEGKELLEALEIIEKTIITPKILHGKSIDDLKFFL